MGGFPQLPGEPAPRARSDAAAGTPPVQHAPADGEPGSAGLPRPIAAVKTRSAPLALPRPYLGQGAARSRASLRSLPEDEALQPRAGSWPPAAAAKAAAAAGDAAAASIEADGGALELAPRSGSWPALRRVRLGRLDGGHVFGRLGGRLDACLSAALPERFLGSAHPACADPLLQCSFELCLALTDTAGRSARAGQRWRRWSCRCAGARCSRAWGALFTPLPGENSALRWQYTHDAPVEDLISSRSQLPIMLLV